MGLLIAEGMHSGVFCNYQGRFPHLLVEGHIFLHFVFGSIPSVCTTPYYTPIVRLSRPIVKCNSMPDQTNSPVISVLQNYFPDQLSKVKKKGEESLYQG